MVCSAAAALVQVGNAIETNYMVPLMGRRDNDSVTSSGEVKYTFVVTNTGEESINVRIVGLNNITWMSEDITPQINVSKGESKVHTFEDDSRSVRGSVYSNQTVMVRSDGYFQLQVFVNDRGYKEGFLGIPQSYLNNGPVEPFNASEYVTSTFCANGGYCQFAVSAFVNDTTVSIKFPHSVPFNITLCKQKTFINSVDDPVITMGAFDTIQFESTYDLSGVHIYSFQPIAVFVGSRNLTSRFAHTIEQLVPSSYWGKEFVVRSNAVSGYGDIVKLTSSWNRVKVSMTGFAPFVISNRTEVVARRIDKGTLTHIKASHEIQVMKVTGASYTRGYATNVSLTYVPPLEAFANVTKGKCYDGATTKLHIISTQTRSELPPLPVINTTLVPFTSVYEHVYEILQGVYNVTMPSPEYMTGILQCDTAHMPLVMRNNQKALLSPLVQTEVIVEVFERACREGFHGESVYNETTRNISAHVLDLNATTMDDDIMMLRAKVCGEGSLVFHTSSKSVHLLFSKFRMVIFECTSDHCTKPESTASWFNKKAGQCGDDMLMYWFRLINDSHLCYGEGVMPDKDDMCNDASLKSKLYNLTGSPTKILMSGLTASAIFNYGKVHVILLEVGSI
ncbi:hypothetical protein DPMN_077548 [Dreissena polymorpha]|uniref:IgGFc-binding protein N-terminal domain-containing protein n=1 Tax=Dreissena polymorpha TaxID=45954 RepID=A0A9D3YKN3_DREPO|nr:hypothetical protein DPMN_077548 [Dreissena polymorpha]